MDDFEARVSLSPTVAANQTFNTKNPYIKSPTGAYHHIDGMTGGMVVRAVEDSGVNVNLVNFHFMGAPSSVSGAYYNVKGTGCESFPELGGNGGNSTTEPPPWTSTETGGGTNAGGEVFGGDGEHVHGPTGFSPNSTFATNLIYPLVSNYTTTLNQNNVGPLGTAAGTGTLNFPARGGNDQLGSMTCIGDERGPVIYSPDGTDMKYRYRAYLRTKAGLPINPPEGRLDDDPECMGTQIQIWNIADTSRIHASNILANGMDPLTWSLSGGAPGGGSNMHGPMGKWRNGTALDYYGLAGRRTTYGGCGPVFANTGAFRLITSTRGDLKSFYDVSTLSSLVSNGNPDWGGWKNTAFSGGSPVDQVNGAGYPHWTQNVRVLGGADNIRRLTGTDSDYPQGIYQLSSCLRVFGWGMPSCDPSAGVATMQPRLGGFSAFNAVSGVNGTPSAAWIYTTAEPAMPIPPLGMDNGAFSRNWFDEGAGGMWQNVKHMAEDKVGGVSIYRSHMGGAGGGEGRDANPHEASFGVGVRSLNLFDLERLI